MLASCLPHSFHQKKEAQQREDGCKIGHSHLDEKLSFEQDATVSDVITPIKRIDHTKNTEFPSAQSPPSKRNPYTLGRKDESLIHNYRPNRLGINLETHGMSLKIS